MFGQKKLAATGFLLFMTALVGCGSKKDSASSLPAVTPTPLALPSVVPEPVVIAPLKCTAALNKDSAAAKELLTLTIAASGGSGVYSVPGWVNSFTSTAALYGKYFNTTANSIVVQRNVLVQDSLGSSTNCPFQVTILPESATYIPTNLSCQITLESAAHPNQAAKFTITAAGGTGKDYVFGAFYPDAGISAPTTPVGTNLATASYTYNYSGFTWAYGQVSNNGNSASCKLPISIQNLDLLVSGSTSAVVGSNIVLSAQTMGFDSVVGKFFKYATSEPNIAVNMVQDNYRGSVQLTISASDNATHSAFNLDLTAFNSAGDSVTKHLSLSFSQPLTCTIAALDTGSANRPIRFQATASTGEALQITDLLLAPGMTNISGLNVNPLQVKFNARGFYYFTLKAKSTSRNTYCNNGNPIGVSMQVRSSLNGCSVNLSPNPAPAGTPVRIDAVLPADSGSGPFTIVATTQGSSVELSPASGLSKVVKFNDVGNFNVDVAVTDTSDGTVVRCSSFINSTITQGLNARVYRVTPVWWSGFVLGNGEFESGAQAQSPFVASTIDVSPRWFLAGFPGVVSLNQWFAVSYTGRLRITHPGTYYFQTVSDDGVKVYVARDTERRTTDYSADLILSNDTLHPPTTNTSGGVVLSAGYHVLKVNYYQGPATEMAMQLKWQTPYQPYYSIVPAEVLSAPLP